MTRVTLNDDTSPVYKLLCITSSDRVVFQECLGIYTMHGKLLHKHTINSTKLASTESRSLALQVYLRILDLDDIYPDSVVRRMF